MSDEKELFSADDLNVIGGMCVSELEELQRLERRVQGVVTAGLQAQVAGIRVKVGRELERRAKMAKEKEQEAANGKEKAQEAP